jgi:hypothetical protein
LHGNERVGPNAVTEFLIYAAETYKGIRPKNAWVTRMIETRSIYVMPTTNAKGYSDNRREENRIDPNRDFAYNMASNTPDKCMETITARAANELWREHMFQLAVSFHGGIQAIGTQWGSYNHYTNGKSTYSPDDLAQNAIASSMSAWAGSDRSEGLYPHGRISDLVYAVYGAMANWGYAANWDTTGTAVCKPKTFGGYAASKTTYNDAMFRAFNILVETSRSKAPAENRFGQDVNVLKPEASQDGQLPRNMRIIFNVVDLVQPYIQLVNPGSVSPAGTCSGAQTFPPANANANNIPSTLTVGRGQTISIAWEVGGAMTVDDTYLVWAPLTNDLASLDATKPGFGLSSADLVSKFGKFDTSNPTNSLGSNSGRSTVLSGFTRWAGGSTWGKSRNVNEAGFLAGGDITHDETVWDREANEYIPAFAACATMPTTPGTYYVMARARVDQKWGNRPTISDPNIDPQSHIVNARTKNSWTLSNNGRKIRAQINWYSVPIKVVVSSTAPTDPPVATQPPVTTRPPVTTQAPVAAPGSKCDCKGTSGTYERCVKYRDTTVCLIKHSGGKNDPPPCDAPVGGSFGYSNNYKSWYKFGCNLDRTAGETKSGVLPLANQVGDDVTPAGPNAGVFAGIGVAVVGVVAVAAVVAKKRSSRAVGDVAVAVGYEMDTATKEAGRESGNPRFGTVDEL